MSTRGSRRASPQRPDDLREPDPNLEAFVRTATSAADPGAFQTLVVHEFIRLSGAEWACYCECLTGEGTLSPTYSSDDSRLPARAKWQVGGALGKWLRANEQPLVFSQQPEVVAYLGSEERVLLEQGRVSACFPVTTRHRLLAMVLIASKTSWSRTVVGQLKRYGDQAALAFEIVQQRHAERLRLEASARTQQLALAGQLASAVAHEVRNPLATIRSSVQYVSSSSADWSSKAEILEQVLAEVDRINRTLSAMLGLSRPEPLEVSQVDLAGLVKQVLVLVKPYVDHQRLHLDDSGVGPAVIVRADCRQLQQVLLNVVVNACQAMRRGGRLSILVEQSKELAFVRVSDTGLGIATADLDRIFEAFYTTKANGTGLGLSICREIVKRHAGRIDVESELGVGTNVTITLPRLTPDVENPSN